MGRVPLARGRGGEVRWGGFSRGPGGDDFGAAVDEAVTRAMAHSLGLFFRGQGAHLLTIDLHLQSSRVVSRRTG